MNATGQTCSGCLSRCDETFMRDTRAPAPRWLASVTVLLFGLPLAALLSAVLLSNALAASAGVTLLTCLTATCAACGLLVALGPRLERLGTATELLEVRNLIS